MKVLQHYRTDEEVHLLGVMATTALLSSHPYLVQPHKALIPLGITEFLCNTMRTQCQEKMCLLSSSWMHFSYPFSCRICIVHCTALYCCVVNDPRYTTEVVDRLRVVQFASMLVLPPKYLCDELTLDAAMAHTTTVGSITAGTTTTTTTVAAAGTSMSSSMRQHQQPETSSNIVALHQQPMLEPMIEPMQVPMIEPMNNTTNNEIINYSINKKTGSDESDSSDNENTSIIHNNNDIITKQKQISVGVFHNNNIINVRNLKENSDIYSISSGTLKSDDYHGCIRNIDYMAYMNRKEKTHIMNTLFDIFNVVK